MLDWLTAATERDSPIGLLLVDLDGFKDVNTLYGYPAGDAVLRETGRQADRRPCRAGDMVARLGGDEFAVLARRQGGPRRCAALAEAVRPCCATERTSGLR